MSTCKYEQAEHLKEPTRVTIIAGFLGAGKTSVLRHLIDESSPSASTAILVNEIGKLGIDGDFIAGADRQLILKELIGGCICCTAQLAFRQAVVEILRRRPERLFVEPTGLAAVGSLLEVFAEPGIAPSVSLDPTLVVIDPRHWKEDRIRNHTLYQEQVKHAGVLVVSHRDCCDDELFSSFKEAHSKIPMIMAHKGQLERPWISSNYTKSNMMPCSFGPSTPSDHGFISETYFWQKEQIIELSSLRQAITCAPPPPSVLRCKGLVHSDTGWRMIQYSDASLTEEEASEGQQSRLVMIAWDDTAAREWWQTVQSKLSAVVRPIA